MAVGWVGFLIVPPLAALVSCSIATRVASGGALLTATESAIALSAGVEGSGECRRCSCRLHPPSPGSTSATLLPIWTHFLTAEDNEGVPPEPPYALSGRLRSGLDRWIGFDSDGGGLLGAIRVVGLLEVLWISFLGFGEAPSPGGLGAVRLAVPAM